MGTRITDSPIVGYNASPPSDDGQETPNNEVEWDKHLQKIGNPLRNRSDQINTKIQAHLDEGPVQITFDRTTNAGHYNQVLELSNPNLTISLMDANSATRGYRVTITNNHGSQNQTVVLANTNNTLAGLPGATRTLRPGLSETYIVNSQATGYLVISEVPQFSTADSSHAPILSNHPADLEHDINFSAGVIADSTAAVLINYDTDIRKAVDSDWEEGDNLGGLASSVTLAANQTLYCFVIAKLDGTVDAGFDIEIDASNLLSDASDFVHYRFIGSILIDSSLNIRQFNIFGDTVILTNSIVEGSNLVVSSFATVALSVPLGINVEAILDITTVDGVITGPNGMDVPATFSVRMLDIPAHSYTQNAGGQVRIITNLLGQIQWLGGQAVSLNATFSARLVGWRLLE